MFTMIAAPITTTFFSLVDETATTIAMMMAVVAATASFLLLMAAVTVFACKTISNAVASTTHNDVHEATTPTCVFPNLFDGTVGDGFFQSFNLAPLTLPSKDAPIKLSFEQVIMDEEQELAPPSINEKWASNGSSAVPKVPSASVHFELEKNQVHEIIHVTEYSQAEKESCWYTQQEFGDMQNNARIEEIVGPAYDHDDFLESGVPAVIFIPVSEEEVNKYTGPAFVDYRDPPNDEDFEDEDEESTASPIKVHPATSSSAVDDMDDLLKAFSKLSLDETNIKTSKTASDEPANNVRTEQKTKPTEQFVGPSFVDYRQPQPEYDDEESTVASAPGAGTAIMDP